MGRYDKATPKYLILVPGVAYGGWPRSIILLGDPGCVLIALDGPGLDSTCLDGPIQYLKWTISHRFELKRAINRHWGRKMRIFDGWIIPKRHLVLR